MSNSRRDFLEKSAALAALGFLPREISATEWLDERERARRAVPTSNFRARPVIVGSANGFHTDRPAGVKIAYDKIMAGGDPLDAVIAGVNTQELDPTDQSVGLGGLPNEEGVVQLDSSCMHGPTKRAGSVAGLEGIATPSLVAKAVMDYTDHLMLVGADAKRFALAMGFKEQDLLTEKSKQDWLRWKASKPTGGWTNADKRAAWLKWNADRGNLKSQPEKGGFDENAALNWTHGTINMDAVTASGDIASVTTTSGMAWKIPGRIGDSPIIGAGQYCDNTVGAAGSTGRGESNIMVCGAFLAVEFMRQGKTPEEALMLVMKRVIAMSEQRLLDDNGRPYFDLDFYAVTKDGRVAGACAYEGSSFATCDEKGPRLIKSAYLFKASERPKPRS